MCLTKMAIIALLLTGVFFGNTHAQEAVQVTIDSISRDHQIVGKVIGLTEAARRNHKVVVFVKTDQWYIHPYAHGGDGKSWASIASDGSWNISTVKREFPASSIAALVVTIESKIPSSIRDLNNISHTAIYVRDLEGTQDYNKL